MMNKRKLWQNLGYVVMAGLLLGARGFGAGQPPWIDDRVMRADTIVIGQTTKVEQEEVRPGMPATTYTFQVERILKGKLYKAGDTIVMRFGPNLAFSDYVPFPWEGQGPHVVFANKDKHGDTRFDNAAAVDEVDIERITRMIQVLDDPPKYMGSDKEVDVAVVLNWLARTFIVYDPDRSAPPRADWTRCEKPERDTVLRYLLKHADSDDVEVSIKALGVLTSVYPAEAYDAFVTALESDDDAKICLGAIGLSRFADKWAVPLLIDRLERFRSDEEDRQRRLERGENVQTRPRRQRSSGRFPSYWRPGHSLPSAILSFDDPRVADFQLRELESGRVLGKVPNDPRVIQPLLRLAWEGKSSALDGLRKCSDPRILKEARERVYDHPFAPRILADQGDPEVAEFMRRLIRQAHPIGAIWAANTRDESAKADLICMLDYCGGSDSQMRANFLAYALGRLRAFDQIPQVLDACGKDVDALVKAAELLMGLADYPRGGREGCVGAKVRDCLLAAIRETAARERWSQRQIDLVDKLAEAIDHPDFPSPSSYGDPWIPPAALPNMPDPLDEEATGAYLKRNLERCRTVLRDGPTEDKYKVLDAAAHCKTNILERELALRLLTDPDGIVRGRAWWAVEREKLPLTESDIQQWALTGDYQSTWSALRYMHKYPKPEYAPIVARVLYQGRHLFDEDLFAAIIETQATQCADLLRAYLKNEHIELRTNAAVTLALLGDEAGIKALPELRQKCRPCSNLVDDKYFEKALKLSE